MLTRMDAAAPPVHEETPKPVRTPAMDIMPPKVAEAPQSAAATPESFAPKKPASVKKTTAHMPKQPRQGIGLAVTATVIIVLGLGTLMVYSYLRTKGISIL